MRITIDGSSCSGKSYLSKNLARVLSVKYPVFYFDTGNIYKYLGRVCQIENLHKDTLTLLRNMVKNFKYNSETKEMELNFRKDALMSSEVVRAAVMSVEIRHSINGFMSRNFKNKKDTVMIFNGRDCGSNMFPDAEYKFFIYAQKDTRIQRLSKRENITLPNAIESIYSRDKLDTAANIPWPHEQGQPLTGEYHVNRLLYEILEKIGEDPEELKV